MGKKRIYLSSPTMHGREQEFVQEAFDTNWIAPLGPNVTAFEQEMLAYTGAGYATALSAGTAAIHLALKLLNIGPGDVVFVSDLTFSATCNPIVYEGATPVFIDAEPDTWNMSPLALEKAFEKYPHPKAVLCAYLYGTPAQINEIMTICEKHHVPYIEDAAESLGSTYMGRHTGTFGKFGIYSFNGNKIITTGGGGMVVCNDETAVKHIRYLSQQAKDDSLYFVHEEYGYNYRMTNLQAALGLAQLELLPQFLEKKRRSYAQYSRKLSGCKYGSLLPFGSGAASNHWFYSFALNEPDAAKRDCLIQYMNDRGIQVRPIWKLNHTQTPFRRYRALDCRRAACFYDRVISIPCSTNLTSEQLECVCEALLGFEPS